MEVLGGRRPTKLADVQAGEVFDLELEGKACRAMLARATLEAPFEVFVILTPLFDISVPFITGITNGTGTAVGVIEGAAIVPQDEVPATHVGAQRAFPGDLLLTPAGNFLGVRRDSYATWFNLATGVVVERVGDGQPSLGFSRWRLVRSALPRNDVLFEFARPK